ncbi:MAG: hypothetical protein WA738_14970, partial [Candidatus Angelobacter sp.]
VDRHPCRNDCAGGWVVIRPDIPVVMMSGYVRPEDESEAQRFGVREVILMRIPLKTLPRL